MLREESARAMRIAETVVTDESPCYVIGEIGHNHQGSLDTAKRLFMAAKAAGADAVKLQKRENRSLFTEEMYNKPYENENSFGTTYGKHREALELDRSEYLELKAYAAQLEIDFFATAFDSPSIDFLEEIDLPAYKVASADIRNIPLLRYLAQTRKPIILSTGGARQSDVEQAVEIVSEGTDDVAILQCTASYPAPWEQLDLKVIESYREEFPSTVVGLSSHDNGIAMAVAAYVLGARIVEKHFTLDRTMKGTDHQFSLEPQGLTKMIRDLRRLHVALGDGEKKVYDSELAPLTKMSKKLVAATRLEAGRILQPSDIAVKSPGDGMCPSEFDRLVGARLLRPMRPDMPFSFDLIGDPMMEAAAEAASVDGVLSGVGAGVESNSHAPERART